jgi:hypothetical protein
MLNLRTKLSYANVMATIAVFMVLGGGAYAAIKVPKNSVGTKQLKKKAVARKNLKGGAVDSGKVADNTLTASKIAGGQVIKDIAIREVVAANVGNNAFSIQRPACQPGETAIAGGGGFTVLGTRSYSNNDVETNTRTSAPIDAQDSAATAGSTSAVAWLISAQNLSGAARDFHAYVVCAKK